ncbi:MAG: quinone-dependent dihydroorotate dehydrogenase [Alphaproteobacteria bacterium]|nr:quinone-dependent dihydroorotate dehydrogenase [Alphaproteobacteria bacterium]
MNSSALMALAAGLLPEETAHAAAVFSVKLGMMPLPSYVPPSMLAATHFGLKFPSPVGLAAGFDKNAEIADKILATGFGFVEVGTVTPRAQPGNPKPRLFRLKEDKALINRLGFNNAGMKVMRANLESQRGAGMLGIVGVNIGKNKDTENALADYGAALTHLYDQGDYITVNVSSPNTPGLRMLQESGRLIELLDGLIEIRNAEAERSGRKIPLLLKVAPDLTSEDRADIAKIVLARDIAGIILTNTTIARPDALKSARRIETGGLSGPPLLPYALASVKDMYRLTEGKLPLVGVGGISSAADAYRFIRAGASLIQLYTALVYRGFGLAEEITRGLADLLAKDGFANVKDAVGADAK